MGIVCGNNDTRIRLVRMFLYLLMWYADSRTGHDGLDGGTYFHTYSISQEICTRLLLCCALLWLYIDWFFPYPSGLLHWHCGNLTIAPVPAKQPWWIWINTSCEFIMNECITTTKQRTTKPCAYFLEYTVSRVMLLIELPTADIPPSHIIYK